MDCIIAIDQGTTSTRAIAFGADGSVLCVSQEGLEQHYPASGWVEHDPEEIWTATVTTVKAVLAQLDALSHTPLAIGITNQRETCVIWDRATGKTVHRAIVWQDRRTAERCEALKEKGLEDDITDKTGLLLDPYFSGTKIAWMLDQDADLRAAAGRGELAAGTIETFLLWRLTGGRHATDATNASRTLLFNIHSGKWDDDLLEIFDVPASLLGEVTSNSEQLGTTLPELFGRELPITSMIGDQQSAAVGQGCIAPGMVKSTYGTGCFLIENTGDKALRSHNRLLTTVAYRIGDQTSYAVEGSIFIAGAAVQWLRDGLGLFSDAAETEALAASAQGGTGVYMVPAFTGLGAPHWDAHARGAMFGLTRDTGPAEIVRAALESVAYQTRDLLDAAMKDGAHKPATLRVDGGMVNNNWFSQRLADILDTSVDRPKVVETTAFGAAFLAGLGVGLYDSLEDVSKVWQLDRRFEPQMAAAEREAALSGWQDAVRRTLSSN